MAVTITVSNLRKGNQGEMRVNTGTFTSGGADTYITGGFSVTAASLGMHVLRSLQITPFYNGTLVLQPRVSIADPKNGSTSATIRIYATKTGATEADSDPQLTSTTAFVSYAADFEAIGN